MVIGLLLLPGQGTFSRFIVQELFSHMNPFLNPNERDVVGG